MDVDQAAVFYLVNGRRLSMLVDIVDAVDANFTAFFITPHNLSNGKKEVEGFAVALRKGLKVQAIC